MTEGNVTMSAGDLVKRRFSGPLRARLATDLLSEHGGLLAALAVLIVGSLIFAPHFASIANILDILRQMAFTGIIGLGMTLVIIAGGEIRHQRRVCGGLHLCAVRRRCGQLGVALSDRDRDRAYGGDRYWPVRGRCSSVLRCALLHRDAGAVFGPEGGALLLTDAIPIPILDDSFNWWVTGSVHGIARAGADLIILFAIFSAIANRTSFGRSVYTIGGNAEAAYLSGIPVAAVRDDFRAYRFPGGRLGTVATSRLAAGNAGMGVGLEFAVITAVIVGGASLFGGKGSMLGTMLGGLFIAILNNAMVLFGVTSYAQYVANGCCRAPRRAHQHAAVARRPWIGISVD